MHGAETEEALYAFMDGELEVHQEQQLFTELAGNPELRSEMKDILSIRNAVHRDVLTPSPTLESAILASAGFPVAGSGAAAVGLSGSWTSGLAPLLYGASGMVVGALLMWFILPSTLVKQDVAGYAGGNAAPPATPIVGIAVNPPNEQQAPLVRVDTVYIRKSAPQRMSYSEATPSAPQPVASEPAEPNVEVAQARTEPILVAQNSLAYLDGRAIQSQELLPSARMSPGTSSLPAILGFRTLASGLSGASTIPQSVQDAMLPNTAFSLTIPLSAQHRVGIEMGSESFVQNFTGTDGTKAAEWQQTPVLFWMGATYQFTPWQWEILPGLSPIAQATVGTAFSQGPIARGTVGLAYQPIGPVRLTIGVDGSALFYTFQNSLFTSTKWGLSYGLSVDLGSWK